MNPSRRFGDSGGGGLLANSKSRSSPILSVGLIVLVRNYVYRIQTLYIPNNVNFGILLFPLFFLVGSSGLRLFHFFVGEYFREHCFLLPIHTATQVNTSVVVSLFK